MDTSTPLQYVKGIGPACAEMLERKGLLTVEDLLFYVPFRYEDRTNVKVHRAAGARRNGHRYSPKCKSAHLAGFRRRNLGLFEAVFTDSSTERLRAKWFHGGYLVDRLTPGLKVALYGKIELDSYTGDLLIMHPEFEILTADDSEQERPAAYRPHRAGLRSGRQDHHAGVSLHSAPHSGIHRAARRSSAARGPRIPEAARSLDRGSRAALSSSQTRT